MDRSGRCRTVVRGTDTKTGASDEADNQWTNEARRGSIEEEDEDRMQPEGVLRAGNGEKREIRGWESQAIQTKRWDPVPETSVRSDQLRKAGAAGSGQIQERKTQTRQIRQSKGTCWMLHP